MWTIIISDFTQTFFTFMYALKLSQRVDATPLPSAHISKISFHQGNLVSSNLFYMGDGKNNHNLNEVHLYKMIF